MATYDITQGAITNKLVAGDIINCPYSGAVQSCTLPAGQYLLEVWGAQGGYTSSTSYGGKGGYSHGILAIKDELRVYLYSGASGRTHGLYKYTRSFNGGGIRSSRYPGGGASDIRFGQDDLYARAIVAGGGGSDGASSKQGMYGGGEIGGSTTQSYGTGGYGGTQTGVSNSAWQTSTPSSSYSTQAGAYAGFGFGGNGITLNSGYGGAGGGGWYGGSGSCPDSADDDDRGGGGGSGYVYTESTAVNYPSGCLLNSSYYLTDAQTIAGDQSFLSPAGASETGHSGDGYCRITVIKIAPKSGLYIKLNNEWQRIKKIYTKRPFHSTLLPEGFTLLQYIQSNGTQYINTGVIPSTKFTIDTTFEPVTVSTSSAYNSYFGTMNDSNFNGSLTSFYNTSVNASKINVNSTNSMNIANPHENRKFHCIINESNIVVDGIGSQLVTGGYSGSNYPITLCAANVGGTITYYSSIKYYGFRYYNENNILIRDLVPAKNSNNVVGMYDLINDVFYTNNGTGDFIAGPELNQDYLQFQNINAYINGRWITQ